MSERLDTIVSNARNGEGPCRDCPAQRDTAGEFVNPGLLDNQADLMVLTMDPSHYVDWETYVSWTEYNETKGEQFKREWRGGTALRRLLAPIPGIGLDDIWLADAIKCPVENDRAGDVDTSESFEHCSSYLREEVAEVDPEVIVTMGNLPAVKLLNGIYDLEVGSIRAGTADCGTVYETAPPVVISPHWSYGWLGRHNNREKVQTALQEVLEG